ncbi:MAG: hypothetical protein AAF918_08295 [Pseudomonadota bacterium]
MNLLDSGRASSALLVVLLLLFGDVQAQSYRGPVPSLEPVESFTIGPSGNSLEVDVHRALENRGGPEFYYKPPAIIRTGAKRGDNGLPFLEPTKESGVWKMNFVAASEELEKRCEEAIRGSSTIKTMTDFKCGRWPTSSVSIQFRKAVDNSLIATSLERRVPDVGADNWSVFFRLSSAEINALKREHASELLEIHLFITYPGQAGSESVSAEVAQEPLKTIELASVTQTVATSLSLADSPDPGLSEVTLFRKPTDSPIFAERALVDYGGTKVSPSSFAERVDKEPRGLGLSPVAVVNLESMVDAFPLPAQDIRSSKQTNAVPNSSSYERLAVIGPAFNTKNISVSESSRVPAYSGGPPEGAMYCYFGASLPSSDFIWADGSSRWPADAAWLPGHLRGQFVPDMSNSFAGPPAADPESVGKRQAGGTVTFDSSSTLRIRPVEGYYSYLKPPPMYNTIARKGPGGEPLISGASDKTVAINVGYSDWEPSPDNQFLRGFPILSEDAPSVWTISQNGASEVDAKALSSERLQYQYSLVQKKAKPVEMIESIDMGNAEHFPTHISCNWIIRCSKCTDVRSKS